MSDADVAKIVNELSSIRAVLINISTAVAGIAKAVQDAANIYVKQSKM